MKKLIRTYTFFPASRTITFKEKFELSEILLITNTTTNEIIYNFSDPLMGGSFSGQTITLDFDTSLMAATDQLQIFVDVEEESPTLLRHILRMLMAPLGYDRSLARSRVTALVESGTITTVSTVTGVTTVSTVSAVTTVNTITNLSQIDNVQGRLLPLGMNLSAWSTVHRSRIT